MTERNPATPDDSGENQDRTGSVPETLDDVPPVGEQIRDLRRAKGLTLIELADRIGRSVGYVSQIERNISTVSVDRLKEIAEALGVQINWFFQGGAAAPAAERDFVVRRSDRRHLTFTGSGITEELLSPNLSGAFEMVLTTYEPHASTGEELYSRPCQEAAFVIEGRLELRFRDRQFILETGDSVAFDGEEPHYSGNPDDAPTRVLWIMSPPAY